ncbi:hypothetical protein L1049_020481 [Liquidambar formosana]|uniref:Uncharacterized protein n=1 Tax=Liquidambar formosana TaxID=63359 RepID=A0AAP0X9W0_LIQFO
MAARKFRGVTPLENATQAREIDKMSSVGSISRRQLPITAMLPPRSGLRRKQDPIAFATTGNSQALLKPFENAAQVRQINMLRSLVSESPILKTPRKRPFDSTVHNRCYDYPPNFKQPKVDVVQQFSSVCGVLAPRIKQSKSEEDRTAAAGTGNLQAPVKPLENAALAKQIDIMSSLGSISRPQLPVTATLPSRIEPRRSEEDPIAVAATGNSQAPVKPSENAAQARQIDSLSSLGFSSRPRLHITAVLSPQIDCRNYEDAPISVAAAGNLEAPAQALRSAAQVKQIDVLSCLGSISLPQLPSAAAVIARDTLVRRDPPPRILKNFPKQDFPAAGVGTTDSVSSSRNSVLAKGKFSVEPGHMEGTVITDEKLFLEEIQGRDDLNGALNENVWEEPEKNIVGQEVKDLIIVSPEDYHRNKVREALNLFEELFTNLSHEQVAKSKVKKRSALIPVKSAMLLREQQKWVNTRKQFGAVSGVDIGDRFRFRAELVVIGLHSEFQRGIDYMEKDGELLATSIVASGRYANDADSSDVLVYCGQGGNPQIGHKILEDQKLEGGNLALYNSTLAKNPVRVVRGVKALKMGKYIYDGLYTLDKFWHEEGEFGKMVFKFLLKRIPGQPELTQRIVPKKQKPFWRIVNKYKKSKVQKGICVFDISQGKEEEMTIRVVNIEDDGKPPSFNYITNMIYPEWYYQSTPSGCDCIDGCLNFEKCSCTLKNGDIPFNNNGTLVKVKPLIYECGPSCKCSSSCKNRVSQHGIRFSLEVFKTKSRGWGLRSRNYISSRSFVCEYVGELLQEKELRERTSEYLLHIRTNDNVDIHGDASIHSLLDPLSSSLEAMDNRAFIIDATRCGIVGRFINYSCSPNLYVQNVIYDHDDKKSPHMMLFAAKNIPPLRELTCDYNYVMGQVL